MTPADPAGTETPSAKEGLPVRHIARALVFDPADRLLLIEYACVHPAGPRSFFFLPGGGLEPGETHAQACSRELGEEIGRPDAEIGPMVAVCDGPFLLFNKARDARERYFLVRLPDDRVDTSLLAETESNPVLGTRWWTLDALDTTPAHVEPAGLAALARQLADGTVPKNPVRLEWHGASRR